MHIILFVRDQFSSKKQLVISTLAAVEPGQVADHAKTLA
jgi:hypothetical protein